MTSPTRDVKRIVASPRFLTAVAVLRNQHNQLIGEIITLTEIPSPPFKEERRARAYEALFRDLDLEDVECDAVGNVTGVRRGRGNGDLLVVAAHLDTVFPEGTDCTVRREGSRLYAPGVGDDTRGLAALLAFIRALNAAKIQTDQDLLFVGDVGEEGAGNLRGIRHLFSASAYRTRISGFFTIDGLEAERLTIAAVGSYRYRVTFRGPGGHSLSAFGTVNPAHAMAAVVLGLSRTEVPRSPKTSYCAAVFGGGSSVNAIPEEVWVEFDLRSEDQIELDRLDVSLTRLIEDAVTEENQRGDTDGGRISAEVSRIGNRPAGRTDPNEQIVRASVEAVTAFGFTPNTESSSTDANIPMSLGVPAIRFGSGGTGGRGHSLDEWIDVEEELSVRGLSAGLAAILGTAGMYLD